MNICWNYKANQCATLDIILICDTNIMGAAINPLLRS